MPLLKVFISIYYLSAAPQNSIVHHLKGEHEFCCFISVAFLHLFTPLSCCKHSAPRSTKSTPQTHTRSQPVCHPLGCGVNMFSSTLPLEAARAKVFWRRDGKPFGVKDSAGCPAECDLAGDSQPCLCPFPGDLSLHLLPGELTLPVGVPICHGCASTEGTRFRAGTTRNQSGTKSAASQKHGQRPDHKIRVCVCVQVCVQVDDVVFSFHDGIGISTKPTTRGLVFGLHEISHEPECLVAVSPLLLVLRNRWWCILREGRAS